MSEWLAGWMFKNSYNATNINIHGRSLKDVNMFIYLRFIINKETPNMKLVGGFRIVKNIPILKS
jgi:hypothetical protein